MKTAIFSLFIRNWTVISKVICTRSKYHKKVTMILWIGQDRTHHLWKNSLETLDQSMEWPKTELIIVLICIPLQINNIPILYAVILLQIALIHVSLAHLIKKYESQLKSMSLILTKFKTNFLVKLWRIDFEYMIEFYVLILFSTGLENTIWLRRVLIWVPRVHTKLYFACF